MGSCLKLPPGRLERVTFTTLRSSSTAILSRRKWVSAVRVHPNNPIGDHKNESSEVWSRA